MQICIIDDERKAAEILEALLLQVLEESLDIKILCSASEGLAYLLKESPDLVFLDIKMPGMTGFQLLEKLSERKFAVVFVTAYDQYTIEAIRMSALDYLLKPVDIDELKNAIARFQKRNHTTAAEHYLHLAENLEANKSSAFKLSVASLDKTYLLDLDEITSLQAYGNYTYFHLKDRTKLLISKTLKEYEALIGLSTFIRTHKSHIVNPHHIRSVHGRSELEMSDGAVIPIARRRRNEVLKQVKAYTI